MGGGSSKSRQSLEGEDRLVSEFTSNDHCELDRIDGEPMEFEWKKSQVSLHLQILAEIQNMMTEINECEPEQFQGRIIFIVNV